MLIYSMSVSVDGFIADREGSFDWSVPSDEQFRFTPSRYGNSAVTCGSQAVRDPPPWETDPSMRDSELGAAFADAWSAIPKVVFSRTLDSVQGNARLAAGRWRRAHEALGATDKDVAIGGATWPLPAVELGLVDELRMFRNPIIVGGGTPFLPRSPSDVQLDLVETKRSPRASYSSVTRASALRTPPASSTAASCDTRGPKRFGVNAG